MCLMRQTLPFRCIAAARRKVSPRRVSWWPMREVFIALGLAAALALFAALLLLPWETLFSWGGILVAAGFGFGVPTGVVYHVQLYRVLRRRDGLPRGWIWKPFDLHPRLTTWEKRVVLPWGYAGGLGFMAIVAGQVLLVAAIIRSSITG